MPTANTVGNWLVQWSDLAQTRQKWLVVWDGFWYSFENYGYPLKNIGIDHASTSAGAHAILATPDGTTNQDWMINSRSETSPYFELRNRKSGLCLGIDGASKSNGAYAEQFPCDGRVNQTWRFEN